MNAYGLLREVPPYHPVSVLTRAVNLNLMKSPDQTRQLAGNTGKRREHVKPPPCNTVRKTRNMGNCGTKDPVLPTNKLQGKKRGGDF